MYVYDGLGEEGVPADAQPWQYVLVPKCITEMNGRIDAPAIYPRYFWSTFVSGAYPVDVVGRWLESLGCDPVKKLVSMPSWAMSHTHPLRGTNGGLITKNENWPADAWTLPDRYLGRLVESGLVLPQVSLFEDVAVSPVELGRIQAQAGRVALDGYGNGLCVWPPVAFRDQVHLDAWLAHHEEWRYGFDSMSPQWPGVVVDPPDTDPEMPPRSKFAGVWELGTSKDCPSPIHAAYVGSIQAWGQVNDAVLRVPVWPDLDDNDMPVWWQEVPLHRLSFLDGDLPKQAMLLYTLTCVQLAYYMARRGLGAAFPLAPGMPAKRCKDADWGGLVSYVASMAASIATMNVGGAVGVTLSTIMKNLSSGAVGAQLPWHDMWRPVVKPLAAFQDWPQCTYAGGLINRDFILAQMVASGAVPASFLTPAARALLPIASTAAKTGSVSKTSSPLTTLALGAAGVWLLAKLLGGRK